jgi:cell division topological specificity factor
MGLVDKLLAREPRSKDIAKQRLQLVLVYDRQVISPGLMRTLKEDIILAISKHLDVDASSAELSLSRSADCHRLILDIPLVRRERRV